MKRWFFWFMDEKSFAEIESFLKGIPKGWGAGKAECLILTYALASRNSPGDS